MFERILVPLDGSRLAECVIPHAVAMGRVFDAGVTLVRVLEQGREGSSHGSTVSPMHWHLGRAEAQAYLDGWARRLVGLGLKARGVLLEGKPAETITRFAYQSDIDLTILSSHGRGGLSHWNVSSVPRKVMLSGDGSMMLIRAYRPSGAPNDLEAFSYRRLMVPVSGSRRAEAALPAVNVLAHHHAAKSIVACVVSKPQLINWAPPASDDTELVSRLLERNHGEAAGYLERLPRRLSMAAETRLLIGTDVAESLRELIEAENVDLVVLSAHGFSPSSQWPYDSVTESLISYGASNLLIVQDLEAQMIRPTPAYVAAREEGIPLRGLWRSDYV